MKPVWVGASTATIAYGVMLIGRYDTLWTLFVGCALLAVGFSCFATILERG